MSGVSAAAEARCASPVARIIVTQRSWPQIGGGPEDRVAEAVVAVAVRVDDDADARRAELAQVVEHLAGLRGRGSRVDDEAPSATEHDDDVLVEEAVAADEDAVADLGPQVAHRRIVPTPRWERDIVAV